MTKLKDSHDGHVGSRTGVVAKASELSGSRKHSHEE